MKEKLKHLQYYWKLIRWFWENRDCPNNRAKWKRLDREIKGGGQ